MSFCFCRPPLSDHRPSPQSAGQIRVRRALRLNPGSSSTDLPPSLCLRRNSRTTTETSALSWETNLNASDLYGCFSPLKDAHTVRNAGLLLLGYEKGPDRSLLHFKWPAQGPVHTCRSFVGKKQINCAKRAWCRWPTRLLPICISTNHKSCDRCTYTPRDLISKGVLGCFFCHRPKQT